MKRVYRLKDVCFRYTNRWILEDISLEIRGGEIFGIIGPNGSGKSSLLKLLSSIHRPQKGNLFLKEAEIEQIGQRDLARTVAIVPQESYFLFPFTIGEIVLMGRSPHLKGRFFEDSHDWKVAHEAMEWVDIAGLEERPITGVSGGEKQRAVIARALAQEPEVLILDEPTASLDIGHQIEIYHLLTRLNAEKGLTIILSSHDLNLASQYCHRLMLMNRGKIYAMGFPSEVITEKNIREVYGCHVIVDTHPVSGLPRVTLLPDRCHSKENEESRFQMASLPAAMAQRGELC